MRTHLSLDQQRRRAAKRFAVREALKHPVASQGGFDAAGYLALEKYQELKMTQKLSFRLEAHADAHASVSPHDEEQAQWELDLREAAKIIRRWEDGQPGQCLSVRPTATLPVYEIAAIDGAGMPSMSGQRLRLVREA